MALTDLLRILLFISLASPMLAGEFRLQTPIDCDIGEDRHCYVQYYPDLDDGPDTRDFACGALTYNGHKGTDFALRSLADMRAGVDVLAAADGVVQGTRDGMPDQILTAENEDQVQGRDCGNGMVIDHGNGWVTQYCHLARGSVLVKTGDHVRSGEVLGQVGLSGRTQFPHLHISVRRNGQRSDPSAIDTTEVCEPSTTPDTIWADPPSYQPGGLISAGFWPGIPEYQAIKAGKAAAQNLPDDAPALVIWGFAFGAQAGDVMRLTIIGPNGAQISTSDAIIEKSQPQLFRATGRRTQHARWFIPGVYTGRVALIRDGKTLSDIDTAVTVTR
ncbi:MAG: M23 family metallopeptidase [Pseudomonadota bacterium]